MLIQAKYYTKTITGKQTIAAVATVSKPVSVPTGSSVVRIFFPFMGAACTSDSSLLKHRVLHDGGFLYLDKEIDGKKVLGDQLCQKLYRLKEKRKEPPKDEEETTE